MDRWLRMGVLLTAGAAAATTGYLSTVQDAFVLKSLVAALLVGSVGVLTRLQPGRAVLLALAFLPFVGGVRRFLEPEGSGADPLVALPAVLALVLLLVPRVRFPPMTPLSSVALALLALITLQSVNPLQGSLRVGITGAVLMAAPVLWFFVGRAYGTRQVLDTATKILIVTGLVVATYGIRQSTIGFLPFEQTWIDARLDTYLALSVNGKIRPFSTFASASEYGLFVGCAAVAAASRPRGRLQVASALYLLVACLLVGSRGVLLSTLIAVGLVLAAKRARSFTRPVLLVLPVLVLLPTLAGLLPQPAGDSTPAVIVRRTLTGLASPLDPEASTASIHADNFTRGLGEGLSQPAGHGPGSVNVAGATQGGLTLSGEADLTDVLIALGYAGLLLLVLLLFHVARASQLAARLPLPLVVPTGLAVVVLNSWFVGGLYSVTAVLWFFLGGLDRALVPEQRPLADRPSEPQPA